MSYSLYHSNPLIDLCTDSINVLGPRHDWFITTPTYLNESDLSIAVSGIYFARNAIDQFKLP